ncbi:unnamed protein product [Symbiodinium microadriaticum]|nr:unnamed protein product [Symbiodinium microadriaticum]CAE7427233.1 unnamed protein product [Symbiodinium sp. KB8]
MSDFISDDQAGIFEDECAAYSAPPVPESKAAAKTGAKRRAKTKAKASAEKGQRESYAGLQCSICESKPSYKKNPYCNTCKSDVEAMAKDAKLNQWEDKYEECKKKPAVFRKLLRDFQAESPSQGAGKKRAVYGRAKAVETIAREQLLDEGTRYIKADYFEFEKHYKGKQLDEAEIHAKWQARCAEGIIDKLGDNKAFPERVLLKVEDYVDSKQRKKRSMEVLREGAMDRGLLDDDKADDALSSGFEINWGTNFFGPLGQEVKKNEAAAAAADRDRDRGKQQRRNSFGSASMQSDEGGSPAPADAVTDLIVSRLRAYEEANDAFQKMKKSFVDIRKKVSEEAVGQVRAGR